MKKTNALTSIVIAIVLALVWINYPPKEEQMVFPPPSFSLDLGSFFRKMFPEPTQLTEAEKAAIKEEIEKNTEVTHGKNYVHVKYTKWLWESPQENFGIFHSQNRRESWGDYNTESNEIGIGIFHTYAKENQDISIIDAPILPKDLSGEIEPTSYKWKSWDVMWGPQKSQ